MNRLNAKTINPKTRKQQKRKPMPRQLSIKSPEHVWQFQRSCNINQGVTATGFVPQVGLVTSNFFCLRFTNQDAFVWLSSGNYSTVSVPGYTDLSALFDEVLVKHIDITLIGLNLPLSIAASANPGSVVILMATDFNDGNAPTAVGDVQQYQDNKLVHLNGYSEIKFRLEPKHLSYAIDASGAVSASVPIRGFVKSNLQIDHYGMKGCLLSTPTGTSSCMFLFDFTYHCRVAK